jgi:uncharacterized membrane protein
MTVEHGLWLRRALRAGLVSVALLPWLPAVTEGVPGLAHLGSWVERWFALQCHRAPDRLFPGLSLVPVCVRCFGIYTGIGLGALVARPRLASRPLFVWLALAALLMVLDVATELLQMRPPSSGFRVLTGLLLAWPVGAALALTIRTRSPTSAR